MSEGTFPNTTTFQVVNGIRQYLFSSTRPEAMTGSGEKTSRSLRELTDLLFQRIKLHLLVQKRNTDHHTEPFSHLPRVRKDENSPVHGRYRPAVLDLVNLVRQLYAPNRRKLVHTRSQSAKDQSTSPRKQLDRPCRARLTLELTKPALSVWCSPDYHGHRTAFRGIVGPSDVLRKT